MRVLSFKRGFALLVGCLALGTFVSAQSVAPQTKGSHANVSETDAKILHNQNPDQAKIDHYNNPATFNMPEGFPVDVQSGSAEGMNYDEAKAAWSQANPEAYNQMVTGTRANVLRSQVVNGNQTTYTVVMGNINSGSDASNFAAKLLTLPEVISANVDPNTKLATVTVNTNLAPNALEQLFEIQ